MRGPRQPGAAGDWDPEPIASVLQDLVEPRGYIGAEYVARMLLLARGIARTRAARVLDIGCGYGALSLALAEAEGIHVTSFDIVRSRVTSVQSKHQARESGRLDLLVADAEGGLPFRPGAFDAAVLTEVLEHVENPVHLLTETSGSLRPGGSLFLTTPHTGALPYRFLRRMPKALVQRLGERLTAQHLHPGILERTPTNPDDHRHEGFTLRELMGMGRTASLYLREGFAYRIPLPDKVMRFMPSVLAEGIGKTWARPFPLGLEVYCEFVRTPGLSEGGAKVTADSQNARERETSGCEE